MNWENHQYETGVKNCVLYPVQSDGYTKGVAWSGITKITEKPSGAEKTKLWADDAKYLTLLSAEEFGGTIEAYMYPDEWMLCDGSAELSTGIVIGQQTRQPFGLSYVTSIGDEVNAVGTNYKIHLVYGCIASPSERDFETINDSPAATQMSWEFDSTPVAVTGAKPVSVLTIDSRKVDAAKLASFKDIIYGKGSTAARLPLPDEVKSHFTASAQANG